MGANAEIRSFKPAVPTVQRSLLDPSVDHTPTIARLLSTPWVRRGSDLVDDRRPAAPAGGSSRLARRTDELVEVETDPATELPVSVVRRPARRYRVTTVIEWWVVDRDWHRPECHVSECHYRVLANPAGGAPRFAAHFELTHDRIKEEWRLSGFRD